MIAIRDAVTGDATVLVELIALLGHDVTVSGVEARLTQARLPTLVALDGDRITGLCGLHMMTAIHREAPVGRITILVVAPQARGTGVGRLLVEAAEQRLREAGCGLVEVTSNDRLVEAHRFYRAMGYDRTSQRFAKPL